MTTFVGKQNNFNDVLKELIELDYDSIKTYETAIERLDNESYRAQLEAFKADYERQVKDLSPIMLKHAYVPPAGPSSRQWFTKTKVVAANLMGDKKILEAVKDNEEDANTAYKRVCEHEDVWDDAVDVLIQGWKNSRRHLATLEQITKKQ